MAPCLFPCPMDVRTQAIGLDRTGRALCRRWIEIAIWERMDPSCAAFILGPVAFPEPAEYTSGMLACQTLDPLPDARPARALLLHPDDNVAVALDPLAAGQPVSVGERTIVASEAVPSGHKVAVVPIGQGGAVRKYGEVIGHATSAISAGAWVHTHNLAVAGLDRVLPERQPVPTRHATDGGVMFMGFRRSDGRVGTRNTLAVISTVNCSADASLLLAARARSELLPRFPGLDDIFAVTHKGGCGVPIGGANHAVLLRCLTGMATHPNVGGVLVMGLGCEVVRPSEIASAAHAVGVPCVTLTVQDAGGVGAAVSAGMHVLEVLAREAAKSSRTPCLLSDLVVGTNCGGSDAYSGITANPVLGRVGDRIMAAGGRWALAESPETCGAEHILARRAVSQGVAERLYEVMNWWDAYTASHGATVDNNPAPGNKEGGITTIYEKALGAVTKGGSAPLADVRRYAEAIAAPGLTFMDTPGMDDVSVTGLVAGGCTLIAFTTGRGSCLAFKPVPVIKIATTSDLFLRMRSDMDFDAGQILGGRPPEEMAGDLMDMLVAVASGQRTAGERQGLGEHTFAPWELGPTL